jgi:hypothetical protein
MTYKRELVNVFQLAQAQIQIVTIAVKDRIAIIGQVFSVGIHQEVLWPEQHVQVLNGNARYI